MDTEKYVEIIILSGREGIYNRVVEDEFNMRHTEQELVSHTTVGRLLANFNPLGNAGDTKSHPSTSEGIVEGVLAKVIAKTQKVNPPHQFGTGRSSKHSMGYFAKDQGSSVYFTIVMPLSEDGPDHCMDMSYWFVIKIKEDPKFFPKVLSDKENFYVNGEGQPT